MKKSYAFALNHMTYFNRRLLSSFQTKTFPLNLVLLIDASIVFCFDLFLNLGFNTFNFAPNPDLPTV